MDDEALPVLLDGFLGAESEKVKGRRRNSLAMCHAAHNCSTSLFRAIDVNRSGSLDFQEFTKWIDVIIAAGAESGCTVENFQKMNRKGQRINEEEWTHYMALIFELFGKKTFCDVLDDKIVSLIRGYYAKVLCDLSGNPDGDSNEHVIYSLASDRAIWYHGGHVSLKKISPARMLETERLDAVKSPQAPTAVILPFTFISTASAQMYKIQVGENRFLAVGNDYVLTTKSEGDVFLFEKVPDNNTSGLTMDIFQISANGLVLCERRKPSLCESELVFLSSKSAASLRPRFQVGFFPHDSFTSPEDFEHAPKRPALLPALMHIRECCISKYHDSRRAFNIIDTNQDSLVSQAEFSVQMKWWDLTIRERERVFKFIDTDGDGFINGAEFEACMECLVMNLPLNEL